MSALAIQPGDDRTEQLVLCGSKDPDAKVTVLLLDGQETVGAVKVPTTATAAAAVAREVAVLRSLSALLPANVRATVPSVVGTTTEFGAPAPILSPLPGTPMSVGYHRRRHLRSELAVQADFNAASRWLDRLQATVTGASGPVVDAVALRRRLERRFAHEPELAEAAEGLDRIERDLGHLRARRVVVHGDYWFGNLLVSSPGGPVTGVVDWEEGSICGSPLRDLARFPLSYALYLDRHTRPHHRVPGHPGLRRDRWGGGVTFAMAGSDWFGRCFRTFVEDGLTRLDLPRATWTSVIALGLADAAATANHHEFAKRHLWLLGELTRASR
jgi:aminoglycoside phosphotransferase (APT) family kinase protein